MLPKIGLGVLADDFIALLKYPGALIQEPSAYFVNDGRINNVDGSSEPIILAYRAVLNAIRQLSESAAYLDINRQELIFIHDGKFAIPVKYDQFLLNEVSIEDLKSFSEIFSDGTHRDQKLAILTDVVVNLTGGVPRKNRFGYLLRNIDHVVTNVRQGYRIYASEFSVSKIRGTLEAARLEYVSKIHKTITDIEGQSLGIPIATVIVASQLKSANDCGAAF